MGPRRPRAAPAGALIDAAVAEEALVPAPVPAGLELGGLLRSAEEALGRRTAAPLAAGEPLTQAALGGAPGTGAAPLAVGERAVAVPLSAAGGAAGLSAGARVDVVASTGEGPAGARGWSWPTPRCSPRTEAARRAKSRAGEALLRVTSAQALRGHGGAQLRPRGAPAGAPAGRGGIGRPPRRGAVSGPLVVAGAAGGCGATLVAGALALLLGGARRPALARRAGPGARRPRRRLGAAGRPDDRRPGRGRRRARRGPPARRRLPAPVGGVAPARARRAGSRGRLGRRRPSPGSSTPRPRRGAPSSTWSGARAPRARRRRARRRAC